MKRVCPTHEIAHEAADLTTYRKVQAAIAALSKGEVATHDGTEWWLPAEPADAKLSKIVIGFGKWLDEHFPEGEPE